MAMTAAERKRLQRERAKRADMAAPDPSVDFLRTPFFEAYAGPLDSLSLYFDMMGIEMPRFDDDSGPQSLTGIVEDSARRDPENWGDAYGGYSKNSLGKAESLVHLMLDVVTELTQAINSYKLEEITNRIAEIERADLSDPEARTKALEDIVALNSMKSRLEAKTFRRSFPEISLKGNASA